MATTPLRPYDERQLNVGTTTGPPLEPAYAGDDFLAGTTYVTGCSGATATNDPKPEIGGTPLGVFEEPDGTIKSYFAYGNETPIDYYCRNDGITEAKYDAISDENKKNYCEEPIGGRYYLIEPNCGYVREVSRLVGVDIWYPPEPEPDPDTNPEPECGLPGKLLNTVTVTGTTTGTGYGVGPYSINSDIGLIAVHAGLINVGDQAKIKILSHSQDKVANFPGSTRNGVTTFDSSSTTQGIIDGISITNPGQLASNSTNVIALSVNGENAQILVTLNSALQVIAVNIYNGGRNYQVGDQFEVISTGLGASQETPALLTVTSVRASTAGGGACGIDLELEEILNLNPQDDCEPELESKAITVDGNTAGLRGPINGIKIANPFADPTKVTNSQSQTDTDFNWYESCPPTNDDNQEYQGQYEFKLTNDSPSYDEEHTDASFTYNLTRYTNMLSGCCPGEGGGTITAIKITDPGARNVKDPKIRVSSPNNGSGAEFNATYDSTGAVTNITIVNGGIGYKVGDKFKIDSTYVFNWPDDAFFEVTAVTPNDFCNNSNRINWKANTVTVVDGGDGFAVGDKFRLQPKFNTDADTDDYTNVFAIAEVTNIEGQIVSGGTMNYVIEKDAQLLYTNSEQNKVVDLVRDYVADSTTDQILLNTADNVIAWSMINIFRMPIDIDFQYWIRQIYPQGGEITPEIDADMRVYFESEIETQNQVQQILSSCDRPDPLLPSRDIISKLENNTSGTDCRWDRNDFFVPTQTAATNLKLKELWDFYNEPFGPSGPEGGVTSVDQIINPRPDDASLTQDDEPDLSDFAGMKVWRWVPCTDGSNGNDNDLGSYIEDTVPSPGIDANCNDQTVEDQYAVYDKNSKVFYNNDTSSVVNLVISGTEKTQEVLQVNQMYLAPRPEGLGRPAGQPGLDYWIGQIANDTVEDRHAIYYNRARVKWSGGREIEHPYVKQTKTSLAAAINDEYLASRLAPAEQAGLDFWVKKAEEIGLDATLTQLRAGLAQEEADFGRAVEFSYGFDRMLEHLAWNIANGDEQTRGGVRDIKKFCEYQINSSLDLSWFHDTRIPPWFGSVNFDGDVELIPTKLGDRIYFKNFPTNQGETKKPFADSNSTANLKYEFTNQYVVNWPTVKGTPLPGQPMPILVKYVEITWYSYDDTNGEQLLFTLQDYTDDRLENFVGPRETAITELDGFGGWVNFFDPDPTLQTLNLMIRDQALRLNPDSADDDPNNVIFDPIPEDVAEELSFDETPNLKRKLYPKVKAEAVLMNPDTGELVQLGTRSDILTSSDDIQANRYFSEWGECTECNDGTIVCPPNTCPNDPTCPDGTPPPCGPISTCNPTVQCQTGSSLQVLVNQPTVLTFRFDVNGVSACSTQGTAKISIRRWWPCPTFSPTHPDANAWARDANNNEIIKRSVPVVNGTAEFQLPVNTAKDDYMAVSYEDQTVDDPGSCHWNFTAYWEYDHPNTSCNQAAWENPGCDKGSGRNQLPEVLCVQKLNCTAGDGQLANQNLNTGQITVDTGKVVDFEFLNPYPDPSKVAIIPNVEGYPAAGLGNPAYNPNPEGYNPNVQNWNWYYECMPTNDPIQDSEGDLIPNESFEAVSITGVGKGFIPGFSFYRWQNYTDPGGPDAPLEMTKGCVDSGGDFYQWYIAKRASHGNFTAGDGYAVGDIVEVRAKKQDPDTVPLKIRITEIEKTGNSTDCSKAEWANEFTIFEMDPQLDCLPYCTTSGNQTFYWNGEGNIPRPGENCSTGTGIIGSLGLAANQNCNDDCPACEQTFAVLVAESTECGPIFSPPGMLEEPYGAGVNNGRFKTTGVDWLATPNFFPTNWNVNDIQRKTDTSGEDYVLMSLEAWVNVPGTGYDAQFTKGVDKAIDWEETDDDEIMKDGWECGTPGQPGYYSCVLSGLATYQETWINYDGTTGGTISTGCDPARNAPDPSCAPGGVTEFDCSAKIRVVGQWYYKYFYKNGTESEYFPINQWSNYNDAQNREKVYEVPEDYWPPGATEANGFKFGYGGEAGTNSYFIYQGVRPVPIGTKNGGKDKGIDSVGIYLSAQASNDEFGNEKYDNPPAGLDKDIFGTDYRISSRRFPWAIGTGGISGPKDEIFLIAKFSVNPPAEFPEAKWTGAVIDGCEDAQVYDKYDFWEEGGLFCGEEGEPGSYSCRKSGLGQYQESWTNYDGTTGGSLRYGCDPWKNAPDPDCAPPLSSVVLKANNDQGGIFDADWKGPAPPNCGEGLRIIWYLNGIIRSGDAELDPGNRLSCGENTIDFSGWATDSNKTYTAEYVIVANNIGAGTGNNGLPSLKIAEKFVNFDWTKVYNDPNAKPYAYSDVRAWTLKRGTSGRPIEIVRKQDGSALSDGDLWQVVLGGASCTFQGNDGSSGDKELTGLKNPDFDIISSDETWNGSSSNLPCYTAAERDCCDPVYAANNPTNRCEKEIIGVIYDCCDENYGNGKLTARVNNANTAWPNIPGTQEKVVGSIKYLWEKQENNGNWVNIPGGTGSVITYNADGSRYRCTVTFDLTGVVPSGYTAKPIKTSTTKVFQADDQQTETCPDGTVVPIGTPCPNTLPCSQPTFLDTSQPEIYVLQGSMLNLTKATTVQVNNNENVTLIVSGLWSGFFSSKLEYLRATAQLRESAVGQTVQTVNLTPSTDPNQKIQDDVFFTGAFQVSDSNTTKNYQVTFTIYYKCEGSASTQVSWGLSNICKVTWGAVGQPYIQTGPECYNAPVYQNAAGCGSWLAQWVFPKDPTKSGLYFMTPGSDERGPKWNANSSLKGNCNACPSVKSECPTISIKNITASSLNINTVITLQVTYDLDYKGFTPQGTPTITWTDTGTVFPASGKYGAQVTCGPFTTAGTRKIQVSVAVQFQDPNNDCPLTGAGITLPGYMVDVFEYDLNIGGTAPPAPTEKPVITGTISGDSTVNLVDGTGTGLYTVDYTVNPGSGYIEADRDIGIGWDGNPTRFNQVDYTRTFTEPGSTSVSVKVSKLYAKPGYEGPLDTQSILDAKMQYWAVTDNTTNPRIDPFPVQVNASQDVVEPKTTLILTGDDRGDLGTSGSVTLNFRATARFDAGTYNPSPEPYVLRYDMEGSPLSGGIAEYNGPTEKSWSRTFTKPGTYRIGARAQRNYCPPGVEVSSTCEGKEGIFDFDTINVVITEPPKGSVPDAYAGLTTYNKTCLGLLGGCGCAATADDRVTATLVIEVTEGTGIYEWDRVEAGSWTWTGSRFEKTQTKGIGEYDWAINVKFFKGSQEVYRKAVRGSYCIQLDPIGPIFPNF